MDTYLKKAYSKYKNKNIPIPYSYKSLLKDYENKRWHNVLAGGVGRTGQSVGEDRCHGTGKGAADGRGRGRRPA